MPQDPHVNRGLESILPQIQCRLRERGEGLAINGLWNVPGIDILIYYQRERHRANEDFRPEHTALMPALTFFGQVLKCSCHLSLLNLRN